MDVRIIAATNVTCELSGRGPFPRGPVLPPERHHGAAPGAARAQGRHPLLVQHFLRNTASESGSGRLSVTPEALDWLMAYDWPGNVRELENVIEPSPPPPASRGVRECPIPIVQPADVVMPPEGIPLREVIIGRERR